MLLLQCCYDDIDIEVASTEKPAQDRAKRSAGTGSDQCACRFEYGNSRGSGWSRRVGTDNPLPRSNSSRTTLVCTKQVDAQLTPCGSGDLEKTNLKHYLLGGSDRQRIDDLRLAAHAFGHAHGAISCHRIRSDAAQDD